MVGLDGSELAAYEAQFAGLLNQLDQSRDQTPEALLGITRLSSSERPTLKLSKAFDA
jgi:hypothetical protein